MPKAYLAAVAGILVPPVNGAAIKAGITAPPISYFKEPSLLCASFNSFLSSFIASSYSILGDKDFTPAINSSDQPIAKP